MSTTIPETAAERRASGFVPIADYGLLADCNSSALVDRAGCALRWAAPEEIGRAWGGGSVEVHV
jgi:hypothetical protein